MRQSQLSKFVLCGAQELRQAFLDYDGSRAPPWWSHIEILWFSQNTTKLSIADYLQEADLLASPPESPRGGARTDGIYSPYPRRGPNSL